MLTAEQEGQRRRTTVVAFDMKTLQAKITSMSEDGEGEGENSTEAEKAAKYVVMDMEYV